MYRIKKRTYYQKYFNKTIKQPKKPKTGQKTGNRERRVPARGSRDSRPVPTAAPLYTIWVEDDLVPLPGAGCCCR